MANTRELRNRRRSASNTRKITRTMELVASAKLKKAQQAAESSRPYAEGLAELDAEVVGHGAERTADARLLEEDRQHHHQRDEHLTCVSGHLIRR